jgi:hypothetical protein
MDKEKMPRSHNPLLQIHRRDIRWEKQDHTHKKKLAKYGGGHVGMD